MPSAIDVFLSYAREDTLRAERLASMLTAERISVWWDRSLLAGQDWSHVIEEQLNTAGCVLVLWSRVAVESRFVRDEARRAIERDAYVPVLLEDCKLPLGFGETQVERLIQRAGEREPSLDRLLLAIRSKLGSPERSATRAVADPPRGERSPRKESEKRNGLLWLVLVAVLLAVVVAVAATRGLFRPGGLATRRAVSTAAPTPKADGEPSTASSVPRTPTGGDKILTRQVAETILQKHRPSIEGCVTNVAWVLYLDFVFTPKPTTEIGVDIFSGSAAGRDVDPANLKLFIPEEFKPFPGSTRLSAAVPKVNQCILDVIKRDVDARGLPDDAKLAYRLLTDEGAERVRRLRQNNPEIQINVRPERARR